MSTKGYKCPCCGGNLQFNSTTQKLHCPSCETELDMNTYEQYAETVESVERTDDAFDWELKNVHRTFSSYAWQQDTNENPAFVCPSCGAKLEIADTTAATSCPYCDSPLILSKQLSGDLKPDLVIPFSLDKTAAMQAYKSFISGKKLLPKAFKNEQKIQEITGIYVPFWLFSCSAKGNATFNGQVIKTWRDQNYEYTKTDYYLLSRKGDADFHYVPVDGSIKMDDAYMESIEPYDMNKAVTFEDAYLAGYIAEKYDLPKEECQVRAQTRIKTSFEQILQSTIDQRRYAVVMPKNSKIQCTKGKIQYALLPVWVLNIQYKDKTYQFMMNGQTGKSAGELPVDSGTFWKYSLGIFAASSFISYLILQFISSF